MKSKKIFVIKIGGEIISDPNHFNLLCKEIAKLKKENNHIVIVHGGGKQITEMEEKLGNTPKIINGRRITDEHSIDIVKMILGKINIEITGALKKQGISAVGLSGVDGNILHAERRSPKPIDYGFVGNIVSTHPELVLTLIEKNFLPVVAPLASDHDGMIYNINADTVATTLALSLKATQLIILTNTEGVYDQNGIIFPYLTCQKALSLIKEGIITHGMIAKIESIHSAIKSGIQAVHLINGFKPEKLAAIFSGKSLGTLITKEEIYYE